jgi:hypothetical protein
MMDGHEAVASLEKSGERCIYVDLARSLIGTKVIVRTVAHVEEFVAALGSGDSHDVQTIGRHWKPLPKGTDLRVYDLDTSRTSWPMTVDQTTFRLDRPGQPLLDSIARPLDDGSGRMSKKLQTVVNLSFLRLKGISEPAGVTFGVNGVYTNDELDDLAKHIEDALGKFYRTFLKPYRVVISVSTMKLSD